MNAKRYLFKGYLLFLASTAVLVAPNLKLSAFTITFLWACNWLGIVYLSEALTRSIARKSLINLVFKSKQNLLLFLVASIVGGVFVEGIGQWVGKLWFYPFFSTQQYLLVAIPGFALYMLAIAECYLATKSVLDRFIRPPRVNKKYFPLERTLYPKLLIIGTLCLVISLVLSFAHYHSRGGYFFNTTHYSNFELNFTLIILMIFGVWFISEYVEYRHNQTSFIKDVMRQYWTPLFAVILATIIFGLSMELVNLRYKYWVYVNWPHQNTHFLGLPIFIFTVWPLQFIMFLSLFRVITVQDSVDIWRPVRRLAKKPR